MYRTTSAPSTASAITSFRLRQSATSVNCVCRLGCCRTPPGKGKREAGARYAAPEPVAATRHGLIHRGRSALQISGPPQLRVRQHGLGVLS